MDNNMDREFLLFCFSRLSLFIKDTCLYGRVFLFIARILWRWEPLSFIDVFDFECFEEATAVVNGVIKIVIQKVTYRGRVERF